MMHPTVDFKNYLNPGIRVHLAGIGGVSMCTLAEVLQGMGLVVQGSDMTESDTVRHLRSLGIQVAIGHSAENLKNCDAVIRTAAPVSRCAAASSRRDNPARRSAAA